MSHKKIINSTSVLLRTLLFVMVGLFWGTTELAAQSSEYGYNKEDYDGDYEYDNEYYGSEAEVNRLQKSKYLKRALREDELYNGGYRDNSNENAAAGHFGLQSLPSRNRNSPNSSLERPRTPTPPKDWRNIDEPGTINPNNNPEVFNSDGSVGGGGKEVDPGEKDPETPPPPPDEPDVPVDTAIPFLLIAGIGLASFRLKLFSC